MVLQPQSPDSYHHPALTRLTDRERQVICLFLSDKSVKEIACVLGVSGARVSHFKSAAMRKLLVDTDLRLILLGVRHDFIELREFY